VTRAKLSREEHRIADGLAEHGLYFDRDFMLEDGNADLFFLYYFPREFYSSVLEQPHFESMNYAVIDHLENSRRCVIQLPGGHGKDLDCDTPILTSAGWKTMGTVQVGDTVYAGDGTPTKVSFVSETFTGHPCYELTFTDGAKIVAGEDHLWWVFDQMTGKRWPRGRYRRSISLASGG
jgi:hypothetical protein